jgi:hypothetical protein
MPNEAFDRVYCPRCGSTASKMKYMFPAPRRDAGVESVIGRFQRCDLCGWRGDVGTDPFTKYDVWHTGSKIHVGSTVYQNVRSWLETIGLIESLDTQNSLGIDN